MGRLLFSAEVRSSYECRFWRSIKSLGDQFSKFVKFEVGNGKMIQLLT